MLRPAVADVIVLALDVYDWGREVGLLSVPQEA